MRPSIFITRDKVEGLRSVAEVKEAIKTGHAKKVWEQLLERADADLTRDTVLPTSHLPGRSRNQSKRGNPDWKICHEAGERVLCAALACLLTEDTRYRDEALRQMRALFDERQWPQWRDMAHRPPADLRTGMLSRDLGIAYDWLHPFLSEEQRKWTVTGIDRRGIQPFWQATEVPLGWVNGRNNWTTCIVGGLGIAGMALGPDHPDSQRLVEFSLPRMRKYLHSYGPDGEFNESIGYAGATRLAVAYFMARWYATAGRENPLGQHPFPQTARWHSYFVFPPGHGAPFGDANRGARVDLTYFAPIAAASRDSCLQWFYANCSPVTSDVSLALKLLWYDDSLEPTDPEGVLPHGRAFSAHGAVISSRADWRAEATAIVVYGKAGVEVYHNHHDAGQVCIDGYGRELIVDLGSPPGYPKDYGEPTRYRYYNASSHGHNILTIGGREMVAKRGQQARITAAEFDDTKGAYWQIDLTALYDGVESVRRTVVHLNPGCAVVVDDVRMPQVEEVSLRWHTVDRCEPDAQGRFIVTSKGVKLASRVVRIDAGEVSIARGQHGYRAPYDRYRLGSKLAQRRESYVEARAPARTCRLLSLFAVIPRGELAGSWEAGDGGWQIETPTGAFRIVVDGHRLTATNATNGIEWDVPLD